jgi:hypothetical protein
MKRTPSCESKIKNMEKYSDLTVQKGAIKLFEFCVIHVARFKVSSTGD